MDDGADLVALLHSKRKNQAKDIWGSTEETTTGVIRLQSMEKAKKLLFPVIAVNEAKTKHFFDNRYGTGQSTMDGVIRATNVLIAGKRLVVAGYGWCGRGCAMRAKGLGADVIVTEVDPLKSIEAILDGFRVMTMKEAAKIGDIFVTLTGDVNILDKHHFILMKDGAIICNSGHFDCEINMEWLRKNSKKKKQIREFVVEYTLKNNRRINVLAEGRLVNLAAAEGHPASVMDMSFANQSLSAEYVAKNYKKLEKKVYVVPKNIDERIAKIKLQTMGVSIDTLTAEQKKYLSSWEVGT
jgi:adenosylhomocysteinase